MSAECHLVLCLALGDALNLMNVMSPILPLAGSWPRLPKLPDSGCVVGCFPHICSGMTSVILGALGNSICHLKFLLEHQEGILIAAPGGVFVLRRNFQRMELSSLQKLHPELWHCRWHVMEVVPEVIIGLFTGSKQWKLHSWEVFSNVGFSKS